MAAPPRFRVPLARPSITEAERTAVLEALSSGWLAHGPFNRRFEEAVARRLGVAHAVSLNSGTSALYLALVAKGIRGEVIVPSFTFVASANAIEAAGATPVFAEVDPETGCLDPADAAARMTSRTEAIMPVHFAGQTAEMGPIMDLAASKGLAVIEDSAETLGGTCDGREAGSFGIGCFSFFPTKNATTGEGGMLTTNDDEVAAVVRSLAGHGIPSTTEERLKAARPWHRAATRAGWNFRMSNVLAAIGAVQVDRLDAMNERRRAIARIYDEGLAGADGIATPVEKPGRRHVYQMYVIRCLDPDRRDALVHAIRARGVEASVHFDPPVHLQPYYVERRGGRRGLLPVTERLAESVITLPIHPGMTDADAAFVVEAVCA